MFVIFCKLVTLLLFTSIVRCDNPTIRQTNNGPVEGIEQTSILGKKYYSFRGIPYAEVPITGTDPYTGTEVDRRFKVIITKKCVILGGLKFFSYFSGTRTSLT